MRVIIANQSELPIYAQIREQIKTQILSGEIAEGTVLPSIRQLAKELGVSVITTTRAYSDLEAEGFLAAVQGKGSIVLGRDNSRIQEQYKRQLDQSLGTAVEAARALQMTREELVRELEMRYEP